VPQKFTSLNKTLKQMILKLDSFGRLWEAKLMWQVMYFIVVSCLSVGHVLSILFYPVVGGRWGGGERLLYMGYIKKESLHQERKFTSRALARC